MIKKTIILLVISVSLASCEEPSFPLKFSVKVTDEEDNRLPDVPVSSGTFLYWDRSGDGFGKDVWSKEKVRTGEDGLAVFEFASKRGDIGVNVFPPPEGYYPSTVPNYQFEKVENGRWTPENPVIDYVLKKKRNPIPLHAAILLGGSALELPSAGTAYGFDLLEKDWVAPHGKGRHSDLLFFLERRYENVYDLDCALTVSFSNANDGFIEVPRSEKYGSFMRLDYLAPESGYQPVIKKTIAADPITKKRATNISDEMNYFLRLRTVVDESGKIMQANYAKIHGDFRFWHNNVIIFQYYYNSEANNRNLEFDPKKNLFPDERVTEP